METLTLELLSSVIGNPMYKYKTFYPRASQNYLDTIDQVWNAGCTGFTPKLAVYTCKHCVP